MKITGMGLFIFLLNIPAFAGIYRHDVPPEQYKQLAAQKEFDCVGEVFKGYSAETQGSCVLVGDRYVLSAAHVFIVSETVPDTQYMAGSQTITTYKQVNARPGNADEYTFRFNRTRYAGKRLTIFPGYLAGRTGDLVLIELEEPVPGVQPAILNKAFDELHAVATGIGFGVSGRADRPGEVDVYMEKIAGRNMIDSVGGYEWEGRPAVLMADLDHPAHSEWNKMGDACPLELEYAVGGGDSGGPLFRQGKQGWEVIGICTGGGTIIEELLQRGYYSQVSEWTRVSVFASWIEKTISDWEALNKSR